MIMFIINEHQIYSFEKKCIGTEKISHIIYVLKPIHSYAEKLKKIKIKNVYFLGTENINFRKLLRIRTLGL